MTWVKIPGFSRYQISESGDVRQSPDSDFKTYKKQRGRLLKSIQAGKYLSVRIRGDDQCLHNVRIHVLIAWAFHGARPKPPNHYALHKDDNPLNNNYLNIEWGSASKNTITAIANGKIKTDYKRETPWQTGEKGPNAKLSNRQVLDIRFLYHKGKTMAVLAQQHNVSAATICNVINYISYKECDDLNKEPVKAKKAKK